MICWFCSVRESEPKHVYSLDMHGEVAAQNMASQTHVAYSVHHVEIPRCADCHRRHKTASFLKVLSAIFAALFLGAVMFALFSWADHLLVGIWAGLSFGLVIACLLSGSLVQKGIHTERSSRTKHPEILALKEKCYRFGARPKEALPKSDPPCNPDNQDENTQF